MLAAPNALRITGGSTTVILALEVFPVPPSVDKTWTLLFFTPAVVPVTFTDNVQEVLIARVPPDRLMDPEPATAVAVPPHVLVIAGGVATTSPAGKLSIKARPVNGMRLATGLVIVNVSEVVPFNGMLPAPNTLVITGGVATARLAVAKLPIPPSREDTGDVMLIQFPDIVPCTITTIVQLLFTGTVPLLFSVMEPPGPATTLSDGLQVFVSKLENTIPGGNRSVNATPVKATSLAAGFVIVKVNDVEPFSGMLGAPKALVITGGATTKMLAEAVPPGTLSFEVTLLVVLFFVPAVVPVTFTEKVQEPPAAKVVPERLMRFVPWSAVIVPPPHEPVSPLGVEITSPAGSVSVKPIPVNVVFGSEFERLNVNVVLPFNGMLGAPNALDIKGTSGTDAICTVTVKLVLEYADKTSFTL